MAVIPGATDPPAVVTSPKRRQIVSASETLFLRHGYGAVSMDAIARAASVSKATLYAHFASKDALFAGIMAEKGKDAPTEDDLFPADVLDLGAALTHIGQRVLRFMLRARTLAIYRVAVAESVRFPELGRAFYDGGPQRFCHTFAPWVAAQMHAGRLRDGDAGVAAQQFMALLRSGVFLRASLALPPEPDDAEIDRTVADAVATFLAAFARGTGEPAA